MKVTKNEKTAEIVGLCFGDGSLTRRHSGKNKNKLRFQLRGDIKEDKEHYNAYIKPLFDGIIGKIPTTIYNGKKPYYGICTENIKICDYLVSLGVPVGVKKELKIPNWIIYNKEYLRGFLRGFIDTDGSVFCGKDYNYPEKKHIKIRMSVASISYKIIQEINESLKELGIHNLIMKPYKQKNPNWKNLNKIQIDGPNVVKYFNLIGSKNPKHITKFEVWKKFGFCPPYTTLEQRKKILNSKLPFSSFYTSDNPPSKSAGMSELGQKSTVEDNKQKPYALVAARVQIPFPA